MRRVVSYVLIGLGVFAVALGLLLRFYAYPKLAKLPLDVDNISVAHGTGITSVVISDVNGVPSPEIRHDLSVTSTTHVTGDLTQPQVKDGGDVAVWIEATKTVDDGSGILLSAYVRSVCLDRHTSEAVAPCDGQYIEQEQGKRVTGPPNTVQQPGLNFKFPFGTEKHDYKMFDATGKLTANVKFDGEDTIKGVDVYRFVAKVKPTKLDSQEVPGSLIGSDEPSVTVDRYYEDTRTLLVEPATGVLISATDKSKQELLEPGQSPGDGTIVYDGTMKLTDKTIDDNVKQATDNTGRLSLLTTWPIVLWIVGAVMVAVGVPLLLLGARRQRAGMTP
jgi:Porin PorA